jgi:hypothetical protein
MGQNDMDPDARRSADCRAAGLNCGCYTGDRPDRPLAFAAASEAESRVCRSAHARATAKIENMPTIAAMTSMVETGINQLPF